MSYFRGPLEMVSGVTAGNALGRLFSGAVTGEAVAQPEYRGSGMLVLEPSFNHFLLLQLDNEEIIVDKGMFYCAQAVLPSNPLCRGAFLRLWAVERGFSRSPLAGTGLVVLESPVPSCEIDVIELQNDTLKVDGNFAILRTGVPAIYGRTFRKVADRFGGQRRRLVNVYRGTGSVWLAPTIKIYNTINFARSYGNPSTKSMNMNTSNSANGFL